MIILKAVFLLINILTTYYVIKQINYINKINGLLSLAKNYQAILIRLPTPIDPVIAISFYIILLLLILVFAYTITYDFIPIETFRAIQVLHLYLPFIPIALRIDQIYKIFGWKGSKPYNIYLLSIVLLPVIFIEYFVFLLLFFIVVDAILFTNSLRFVNRLLINQAPFSTSDLYNEGRSVYDKLEKSKTPYLLHSLASLLSAYILPELSIFIMLSELILIPHLKFDNNIISMLPALPPSPIYSPRDQPEMPPSLSDIKSIYEETPDFDELDMKHAIHIPDAEYYEIINDDPPITFHKTNHDQYRIVVEKVGDRIEFIIIEDI